ncbi:MAG TPA: M56 family metallopeptidase [Gemmatimonadaceae bacterium]|nr:M56 family metallopeptidase [Gemmatimonadaceae bacterium]
MIVVAWMVFAILIGVALSVAAAALEGACRRLRLPVRFVWGVAIAAGVVWPLVALVRSLWPSAPSAVPLASLLPFAIDAPRAIVAASTGGWATALTLPTILLSVWAVVSLILLARLLGAVRHVRRQRATWRDAIVDGVEVEVSGDVGPAVVGIRRGAIVLPDWTLALDAPLRALMLRHELEHRDAGDPALLLAAAILWRCVPWNPAVWYAAHRLRHAIEMDCDNRVLERHPEPGRYGRLLIVIAQRQSSPRALPVPTLSEPVSQLERRIRAIMQSAHKFAGVRAIGLAGIAAVAVAAACAVNTPDQITATGTSQVDAARVANEVSAQARPLPGDRPPDYPDIMRSSGISGTVVAQFVVGTDGTPDTATFRVIKATHPLFASAVKAAVARYTYAPATVQGQPVKQLIQQTFEFMLNDQYRTASTPHQVTAIGKAQMEAAQARANASDVYSANEVSTQVRMLPGGRPPHYPDVLRGSGISGTVAAQFVVGTDGTPDTTTFRIIKATDPRFASAVKAAVAGYTYAPAMVQGKPVKQLVQQSFEFRLNGRSQ